MGEELGSTVLAEGDLMRLVYKALEDGQKGFLARFAGRLEDIAPSKDPSVGSILFVSMFEKAFREERMEPLKSDFLKGGKQMCESSSFQKNEGPFLYAETLSVHLSTN